MNQLRHGFGRKVVVVWAAVLTLGAPAPVLGVAATNPANSGQGLEISPPVVELQADPGQTVTTAISIRNVTKGALLVKAKTDDFGAGDDESGQPQLLLDTEGQSRFSLKYWVSSVTDLTLAAGELKKNQITIKVPKNAEPGGHFGVVRFTAVPPELEGTGVALSASVGTLILVRVSGNITDKLSLEEFSTGRWKGEGSVVTKTGFFEYGPVAFVVRLKNEGSVHEKPKGTITVSNTFGKQVGSINVNDKGGNVLPDSVRRFEQELASKRLFGRYVAKLDLSYATDQKLTATKTFWVIPWKLIALGLIGLVAMVWIARLAIKRYNRHIINQARRR